MIKQFFKRIYKLIFKPKIWVISDTHFYHKNIIAYSKLPFKDTDEMADVLIRNWNKKVRKCDTIIHCGDFGFGSKAKLRELAGKLNGKKILILGNHDRHSKGFYRSIFDEVYKEYYDLFYDNKLIYFSHYPFYKNKNYVIYGHIHTAELDLPKENTFCACIEHINFEPVLLDDIIKGWNKNEKEKGCSQF